MSPLTSKKPTPQIIKKSAPLSPKNQLTLPFHQYQNHYLQHHRNKQVSFSIANLSLALSGKSLVLLEGSLVPIEVSLASLEETLALFKILLAFLEILLALLQVSQIIPLDQNNFFDG
jgi:hypothetical protein